MRRFFRNRMNVIVVSILAVALIVTTIIAVVSLSGGKQITIPDFVGKSITEVENWAKENDVKDEQLDFEYVYTDEVEAGYVVYQSPYANEKLLSNLVVYISLGGDPNADITIPSVDGKLTIKDVKAWAEKYKMTNVTLQYVYVEGKTEGTVLKILDENLKDVTGVCKRDTVLYVVVACGTNPEDITIEMPNLVGMSLADLKKWGTASMISIKYNYEYSDKVEKGLVMSQSVAAGTKLKGGSQIQVTISVGKGVEIADLTNKTKDEAKKYCEDNYLKIAYKEEASDKIEKGKVISTDPKAGTIVKYDSVLTVVISTGNDTVEVPDNLLGTKEADFVKKMNDLGLKVAKEEVTYFSTTLAKGTVYSYNSGKVSKGSTIKYALSEGSFYDYLDSTGCKDYNGLTQNNANRLMDKHNARNAHGMITFTKEPSTTVPAGQTFNCKARMESGVAVTVACSVAENSTATIMPIDYYNNWVFHNELHGRTMAQYLQDTLSPFASLTINYEYNTTLSDGQVLRIIVDGKDVSKDITGDGKAYPTSSKVEFVLATSSVQ